MFYVYSTATCPIVYAVYEQNTNKDLGVIKKRPDGTKIAITINGGHGVANKHFVTPRGAVTSVSDEDMEILLQDKLFKKHMDAGFMSYEKKEVSPEKKADTMAEKDGSAPLTPADFEEGEASSKETKVYKKKGANK